MTLTHALRDGWQLPEEANPEKPARSKSFVVKLDPEGEGEQQVRVVKYVERELAPADITQAQLEALTAAEGLPAPLRKAITEVHRLNEASAKAREEVSRAETSEKTILEEQSRLQTILAKLPEDSKLYTRYIEKLDQAETELEGVRERIAALTRESRKAESALEEYVTGLDVK